MAGNKNRTQLQALFKTGAKPSEEDFRDFINSVLNINDDGLEKPPGVDTPLKILAHGDAENLLDFYAGDLHTWRLNQKPTGANPGLNFETGGISKLFVESSTGNLGLSITQPTAKLHIQQSGSLDALRIDDETSDTTPLIVDADGKVGIGKAIPTKLLDVNGDAAIAGPLMVSQTSTLTGNVGIGTIPGKGGLKLNVAGNTALSGTLSVTQTSHLIGNVGIGTGPGAEKLKVDGALAVSQTSTLTGNVGIGVGADTAHKLTVYGGELALKVDDNKNTQSILFQNSGGVYTWRIYREDIGGNKADLKIASGASSDYAALTDYIRIQNNGNTTFSGNLSVTGTSSFVGSVDLSDKLKVPGDKQIAFTDNNTSNNLKLQLWSGYGLGINGGTLFYAANGKHSWRDANGVNERMMLTTTAGGGLTVKGTGTSSFAGSLSVAGALTVTGATSGAANDYEKAQFTLSGGGTVSWSGPGGRLKWNARFIAISMGKNSSFANGHINIIQPTSNIPAANVYDGKARSATAAGVVLNSWEALYAVHTVGGNENVVSFQIVRYTHSFNAPSNWILVGVVNHDDGTIKLGTGTMLSRNSSSTKGSPIPTGAIIMWSGTVDNIPDGWVLCNGQNGAPNLANRFVLGITSNTNSRTGGSSTHSHTTGPGNDRTRNALTDVAAAGKKRDNYSDEPHTHTVSTSNHTPPYYKLAFLMKL